MEKEKLKEVFEFLAKTLDDSIAQDDRSDLIREQQAKIGELERFVAELLYGFVVLSDADFRNHGIDVPSFKHNLKMLSHLTNPDRADGTVVNKVEDIFEYTFHRKLTLSQSATNGIPDDLRIVK